MRQNGKKIHLNTPQSVVLSLGFEYLYSPTSPRCVMTLGRAIYRPSDQLCSQRGRGFGVTAAISTREFIWRP